jgi:hypothetical protein
MPFLVFLSHSSAEKPAVEALARRLAGERIQAWLRQMAPDSGRSLATSHRKGLGGIGKCAVFEGPSGFGPW